MRARSKRPPISGAQVRAARAFLGWTARALAKKAEVPEFTLEWIEGHGRITGKDLKALAALRGQLAAAGIEFTNENGVPGLRLHPKHNGQESNLTLPARSGVLT
jgi:hypothetical protein